MSIHHLDRLFKPQTVAVVGASEKVGSIGNAIMRNLTDGGFNGEIYPVHNAYRKVWGRKVVRSVNFLPKGVDLAVVATPIETVPGIIDECARLKIGGAVIISAGGKESGEDGVRLENEIRRAAQDSDLRIIGPNCLGIISCKSKLNASFAGKMPLAGKMAFVSQSGAICTAILDFSLKENIGFSYFVSLGSMLDVDFGDMIDYLGTDPEVSSIVMYMENLTRIRNFMSAARGVSRVKPIIVLKAGRTKAGSMAAASHTGAMASEDAVYDVALERAGIVRVRTFQELFDCAAFISKAPKPGGSGLVVVTNAGGPGVMAVDALSDYGLEPLPLDGPTIDRLNTILPPHWSHGNPVDILGDADPARYQKTLNILMAMPGVHGLLVMLAPQALTRATDVARAVVDAVKSKRVPVFTCWMGGDEVEAGRNIFHQAGIPHLGTPERSVRAFMDLYRYGRNIELLSQIPPSLPSRLSFDRDAARAIIQEGLALKTGLLTEVKSKRLLAAYGIPVNAAEQVNDKEAALACARAMGYPVALKVSSTEIMHKSDVGGVELNVSDDASLAKAFDRILENCQRQAPGAHVEGVSVQKMVPMQGYELIVGIKKDPDFGPVIMFGAGGLLTEVFADRALALPPLNRLLARRLMEKTKIYRVLKGYRNRDEVDMGQLEELLIRLSQLATDFADIEAVDINPLIVCGSRAVAVDARVMIKAGSVAAPLHLVISPYPNQDEMPVTLEKVGRFLIRPVRPEDAPLVKDFFATLSPQTIYFRFFSPLKTLPIHMLARFTQIDYDREIALVAVRQEETGDRLLGMARVIPDRGRKKAEFAVLVGDDWHGKGVGAALLQRCLAFARRHGFEVVTGAVLPDNTKMLSLGKKLGFSIRLLSGSDIYELSLLLTPPAGAHSMNAMHGEQAMHNQV